MLFGQHLVDPTVLAVDPLEIRPNQIARPLFDLWALGGMALKAWVHGLTTRNKTQPLCAGGSEKNLLE